MLWKLLLTLAGLFSHGSHRNAEQHEEFVPTPYGPQTPEEAEKAFRALHGDKYGGDMVFPDNYNETDAGIRNEYYRWPRVNGYPTVPYVIDGSLSRYTNVINQGIQAYHTHTCIRFKPRTNERDFVYLYYGNGCWSIIGRNGGRQLLSLGDGCAWPGLVVHELGHAIGLFHEHQRSDRNNYIWVYKNNVEGGQEHNFDLTPSENELKWTRYDYQSIMHYGNYAFSRQPGRLMTMEAKNGQRLYEPYEKHQFTQSDLITIKNLYRC